MGLSNLLGLCLAVFSFAALAANPPVPPTNPVGYTTITTPYSSSTSPPQISHTAPRGVPNVGGGSSYPVPPTRPITPIVSNGGFSSPASGGITITGVKTPPIPTTGTANYPPTVVKNGAKALLRGNLAGLVLGAGLQSLLNGIGALIEDGGTVKRMEVIPAPDGNNWCMNDPSSLCGATPQSVFDQYIAYPSRPRWADPLGFRLDGPNSYRIYSLSGQSFAAYIQKKHSNCPVGYEYLPAPVDGCAKTTLVPIPPPDLDDAVDNLYNPAPSDFDNLSPYMFPQSYTQNPIPSVVLPSVTTTDTDSNGNTTTTNTTTTIDFTVDNSKPIPGVDTTVTDDKDTFTNGQPSGSSSTSTTTKANTNPKAPPDPAAGGAITVQFPEIPTDCEFMPTVCAFLEWYKDDDLGEDPDLSSIMKDDEEFEKTKVISFGAAVCPAPHTIQISSLAMSVDLSFDFFCQFAEYAKALVLAAAYIFAAYISLGVARG